MRDGVFPAGYAVEFGTLAECIDSAAERQNSRVSQVSQEEAAAWLNELRKTKRATTAVVKLAEDTARFQKGLHQGPTARRDTEEAERRRWVEILAGLLLGTPTPMGKVLAEKPGNQVAWRWTAREHPEVTCQGCQAILAVSRGAMRRQFPDGGGAVHGILESTMVGTVQQRCDQERPQHVRVS